MEFRVLGPVEIHSCGRVWAVGPPQQRLVLAALALEANRPVTVEALIDRVWDEAPDGARRTLHVLLTRLRRLLAQISAVGDDPVELIRRSGGYALLAKPERVDAHRILLALQEARRPDCPAATRLRLLREALGGWRGEPLAGLPGQWAMRTRQAWQQRRIDTVVGWAEAELAAGDPAAVLGPAGELAVDHPLLEPLAAVRMQALAATGRTTEALDEYARIGALLAEEVGAEPGAQLQSVRLAVLRGQFGPAESVAPDQAAPAARRTLPADLTVFVGRDKELHAIDAAVTGGAHAGGVIAIHAIDGMPGIGKTTLAVHIGHRLADRFADGQLFINLHAHTPGRQPTPPDAALAELLAADGLDPRFLPATLDGRASLWRDRLAGRRMLIVLDNAASTEQVGPLLPGSAGCLVLITSRRSLRDLPAAVPMLLDVLGPDEAVSMFVRLAPRAAADRQAVADLVRACGYLPLAVSITASLYVRHRSWTVGDVLREVERSTAGMVTVAAEDRTVAAVFDLSYQHLPPPRQRFFRLAGLHPGADLDAYAAAALAGIAPQEAAEHLDRLHGDHLLEEPGYRRYRMHSLIRAYTHALATTADPAEARQAAIDRLLDFYGHTAARADANVSRFTRRLGAVDRAPAGAPELVDWERSAAWLRAERANLLACIQYAIAEDEHAHTVRLAAGVAGMLSADGPWTQAVAVHEAAAAAAQQLEDTQAKAGSLHDWGVAQRLVGDFEAAAGLLERSLKMYREAADRYGQSKTLHGLGVVRRHTGDYQKAAQLLAQALELHRDLGDRRGEAYTLYELGVVLGLSSDYPGAADVLDGSLRLHRALGDRRGQANALRQLAEVHRGTGRYLAAAEVLSEALELHREVGDRLGGAYDLRTLGVVKSLTGDYSSGAYLLGEARRLHRALGDRLGEASAINELGVVRTLTGDYSSAADLLGQAAHRYRTLGDRHGEAIASSHLAALAYTTHDYTGAADLADHALKLYRAFDYRHGEAFAGIRLAVVAYRTGDFTGATERLHEALAVFREVGAPDDEAEALNHLGTVHRLTGQPDQALILHRQALDVARRIHYRLEEAHAIEGLGRATLDLADTPAGIRHLRHALNIYRQLGVPEAEQVSADLAHLDPQPATSGNRRTRTPPTRPISGR